MYRNDTAVLMISGNLDFSKSGLVLHQFDSLEAENRGKVMFDLSGVQYLDSVSIKVIVQCSDVVIAQGGRAAIITSPKSQPARIMKVTGISGIIPTYPDLESAVESLTSPKQ